jgi:hypothetical protein
MRLLLLSVAMFIAASTAWAQQPTPADFYAARDRARQELGWTSDGCRGRPDLKKDEFAALETRLEAELDALLRRVVGSITAPKGFAGQGAWQPGLGCGLGMDALDGIVFSRGQGDDPATVLVTSDGILRRWLAQQSVHKTLAADDRAYAALLADPDAAFADGRIDVSIVDFASWWEVFAFLPVVRPAGVEAAAAFLGTSGNGDLVWPPRLISVYLRQGDRIYLADADLTTRFAALAPCEARRSAIDAFNACWKERGRDQPEFAAAHWQAQALVDALAAR